MLHIAFLNVGQGDTIVICNPLTHEAIVVDCLNPLAVLDFLKCEQVHRVRAVVVTHLHLDHYDGLIRFLEDCESRGIDWDAVYFDWINNVKQKKRLLDDFDGHSQAADDDLTLWQKKRRGTYQTLASWAGQPANKARVKDPVLLDTEKLAGMTFERLHPVHADIGELEPSGLNNLSIVLRVSSGGASVLLTGDLEPLGWDKLEENTADLSSNVLKFPHHGAWRRDDVDALLDKVGPEIVIISVGTVGHRYDHPNTHVFDALRCRKGIDILCTQVTKKCVSQPTEVQGQVQALLAGIESKFHGLAANKGCPCASTIVIELGDRARILYPPRDRHLKIIEECLPEAQCLKGRELQI